MAEEMLARSYQTHIQKQCENQNSIIFLPTGSGKTFISVQIVKRFQNEVQKPYSLGGKRTFFLVNSIMLVEQQVRVLQALVGLSIQGYTSQDKVDLWTHAKWLEELEKTQLLVMTAQILLDIIQHNYLKLNRINLLVFDECHHAVSNHPMRMIMKKFEGVPKNEQPKILGLTATLLNKNLKLPQVEGEIRELEKTFNAKICTTDPEHASEVFAFSTNPTEFIIPFSKYTISPPETVATKILLNLQDLGRQMHLPDSQQDSPVPIHNAVRMWDKQDSLKKFIKTSTESLFSYMEDFGVYGTSLAMLAMTVICERRKLSAGSGSRAALLQLTVSALTKARAVLERSMAGGGAEPDIRAHSSPKVRQLLDLLGEYSPDSLQSDGDLRYNKHRDSLSALIFVQERIGCKVLGSLLKRASRQYPELSFLKADYAVGFNANPYSDTREELFQLKKNKMIILEFVARKLNCLVTTQVMEEGIDIPRCSLVVRFDSVPNFRSYVQAKGRGRHVNAVYAILVPGSHLNALRAHVQDYVLIEKLLNRVLIHNSEEREVPTGRELAEKYKHLCPPYVYKDASVSLESAIALLHRYCTTLPQDMFTVLQPEWYQAPVEPNLQQITVLLPLSSPCKDPIKGVPMMGKKNAKRAAALKACEVLHKAGELDDKLLPKDRLDEHTELDLDKLFFSHWIPELPQSEDGPKLGTKKNTRTYGKKFPKCLRGKSEERSYFVHGITMRAVREKKECASLYELLEDEAGLCVLTQHPLPLLCPFSLYLSSGEIKLEILPNQDLLQLTEPQFQTLKSFHWLIFNEVLCIQKAFMAWDETGGDYCFLVGAGRGLSLDWATMERHERLEPCREPPVTARRATPADSLAYEARVVEPWYRTSDNTRHIVTRVCSHMSPSSTFSEPSRGTFADYFFTQYGLTVLGPANQPLLEVNYLSNKMNALLPRTMLASSLSNNSKTRFAHSVDGHRAGNLYLIPEFCTVYSFPGVLWLKATLLPSILHRMTMLLQAEELRTTIAAEAGLGYVQLPTGVKWQPLQKDIHTLVESQNREGGVKRGRRSPSPSLTPNPAPLSDSPVSPAHLQRPQQNYQLALKKLKAQFPWEEDMEPVDIERNFDTVSVSDIECFQRFINQKIKVSPLSASAAPTLGEVIKAKRAICPPPYKYDDSVDILSRRASPRGPELGSVLEALTTARTNDTFSLERLETLGDSLLKLGASLFLFHRFPGLHEGHLTSIKGRLVSNRNLYYCGIAKELPGRLKVDQFSPKNDSIVPGFCTPRALQEMLMESGVCPSVLYSLNLPREEMLSGKLSETSLTCLTSAMWEWAEEDQQRPQRVAEGMDVFLARQSMQDKVVADAVEALLGVYLLDGGVEGCLRLMQWFNILPAKEDLSKLLEKQIPSPLKEGNISLEQVSFLLDHTIPQIQSILDYTFEDPSLLLQAMSHSSNVRNRVTGSYQRLEFLGDAVLDALVTCHVHERAASRDPGEVSDLRSALVNNTTLAAMCVRLGLHRFLQSSNVELDVAIAQFVKHQIGQKHLIDEAVLHLLQEDDCNVAEYVEVPKALGDLLEAVIGAIFLDCRGDLATVWRVVYRIMHREIALFMENVPINPVRLIYEHVHAAPSFQSSRSVGHNKMMVPLKLRVKGEDVVVHGFGRNTALAKRAASKIALRLLDATN